jgi:hypothetical protein
LGGGGYNDVDIRDGLCMMRKGVMSDEGRIFFLFFFFGCLWIFRMLDGWLALCYCLVSIMILMIMMTTEAERREEKRRRVEWSAEK